ncbi:MAG: ABC transporter ATP-binding protein [Hyphomicrobiales bacterium]|nr:ABC transporter ATP-binding protein [Hyphomicrobiales bacterium]
MDVVDIMIAPKTPKAFICSLMPFPLFSKLLDRTCRKCRVIRKYLQFRYVNIISKLLWNFGEKMLRVFNLTVSYGSTRAVDDASLSVADNSITCVFGLNGAGKSSLLRAIVGLAPLRSGEVFLDSRRVTGSRPEDLARLGMTLVPEGRDIFKTLTVQENLMVPIGPGGDDDPVAEVLELFPILRERLRSPAGLLSGGEQQQLAIARALVMRPKMILVDEPSLGLAPLMIEKVYSHFLELKRRGLTILVVEQNVSRVLSVTDKAYLMSNGHLQSAGGIKDLVERKKIERAYFGESPERR